MKKQNTQKINNDVNNIVVDNAKNDDVKKIIIDNAKLCTNKYDDVIAKIDDNQQLRVSNVARILNLNEKKSRSFLRRHPYLYFARKQMFTKSSTLFVQTFNALCEYKKTLSSNATI